jgi:DNA mismatch repair protein MutH
VRIITRAVAISNLKQYVGQDLRELAHIHGITTFETGRQNKGWKGLVLERLAGLENNTSKAPNGLTWELKSVSFRREDDRSTAKETMAITMINAQEVMAQEFFDSHCWAKLKTIVLCAVMWTGTDAQSAQLLRVSSIDFMEDDEIILEIKADYDLIRQKLTTQGFEALTGRDGKWIQARTKGPGHGSVSRAFYARKALVQRIFDTAL